MSGILSGQTLRRHERKRDSSMDREEETTLKDILSKLEHNLDELEAVLEAELALAEMTRLELEDKRRQNERAE